ncbi:MAG: hypothetical protein A2008_12985 [Candidatus Wallbacteria bacterium GWC2_49_35]|uniref:CYTH domain-containing protein n=1 Tax=Candidatus Wallbacteria bacterium GWC2_49_35 TaxID=1817813 RepID=A0A1F7WF54_9BACT|nr:MAG: hypothetical protein A2008_12985 [Candidatus Wallbacteria bacterium GWC2_49_35]HBC75730.1 hypothetical protein [Candidatus Wallbacteria bacterium]
MSEVKPRFEFRTFAQNFGMVINKMRKLSPVDKIRESSEIYIMSAGNNENNTKVRDDLMDIKVFVTRERGLEQWNPRMKGSFPMKASVIGAEVFAAFGVAVSDFKREEYTLAQFLDEIIRPHKDLAAVKVFKRRYGFTVNNCITEYAELLINGAAIQTVAVESVSVEDILGAKDMLGLNDYENINYLLAIKRIIGMEPLND